MYITTLILDDIEERIENCAYNKYGYDDNDGLSVGNMVVDLDDITSIFLDLRAKLKEKSKGE